MHGIDPSWHLLGLGYQDKTDIESVRRAAVIHYNGQCKPWLDIAFKNLRPFWTKHVNYSNDFVRNCHILEPQRVKEWLAANAGHGEGVYFMIRLLAGEADCCWINILVNQESNQHSIQLTIPCESWAFKYLRSFHLYHRGTQFLQSVSYWCIILFYTVTAQKELWDWADPSSQNNSEG